MLFLLQKSNQHFASRRIYPIAARQKYFFAFRCSLVRVILRCTDSVFSEVCTLAKVIRYHSTNFPCKRSLNTWYLVVVVAQLVERPLPTLEVLSSNPVIGKHNLSPYNCIEKMKINNKRPRIRLNRNTSLFGVWWCHNLGNFVD